MALRRARARLISPEEAIAQQLIAEVDRFNVETTGITDVCDLLVTEISGGVTPGGWRILSPVLEPPVLSRTGGFRFMREST